MKREGLIEWALKWGSEVTLRLHDVGIWAQRIGIRLQEATWDLHQATYLEWQRRNMERRYPAGFFGQTVEDEIIDSVNERCAQEIDKQVMEHLIGG